MYLIVIVGIIFTLSTGFLLWSYRNYKKHIIDKYKIRVHVNGIRGKSSVTRLIAGALREADIKTLAKTTGTSARIILSHDEELPIRRKEANITEQTEYLQKYSNKNIDAVVFECMAINPEYAKYLEHKVMHSHVYIITNIRIDHTDHLGETLEKIATAMSDSIPYNSIVITSENRPEIRDILEKVAASRNTKFVYADANQVSDKEVDMFDHVEFKDNISIALEVAKIYNIDRKIALAGMTKANPDPGVLRFSEKINGDTKVHWINAFAANDSESFITILDLIQEQDKFKNLKKVIILNNRKDRPERVEQFANIALESKIVDEMISFGSYEQTVKNIIKDTKPLYCMGDDSQAGSLSGGELFEAVCKNIGGKEFVLIGSTNIHTAQADRLLEYFGESH